MQANFVIIHCANCKQHQLSTKHDEEQYISYANMVEERLLELTPNVTINKFPI